MMEFLYKVVRDEDYWIGNHIQTGLDLERMTPSFLAKMKGATNISMNMWIGIWVYVQTNQLCIDYRY